MDSLKPCHESEGMIMRRALLFFLSSIAIGAWAGPSTAQSCQRVELPAGFTVGDIKGVAPAEGIVCYDLIMPQGQNISVEVVSGRNIATSGPGWDARADRLFIGDLPGQMELRVFQLMRAVQPEDFAVRIRFEPPGNG